MIKITTIFGEDAVREYEENNELPSEEWLADNGGVVDEKEFETEAEYNAYIAGVNDADGWSDYHIIRHRSEEADTSREENLWLRLGISVRGSRVQRGPRHGVRGGRRGVPFIIKPHHLQ